MMKLLIVDDEYNIREGLAKAVDWASAGAEAAGAAGSGAEALELFDRIAPDIVITDIFMEEMNGLELIEAISERNRSVKFILISGYDEFAYARKAIDLKVFRYLLKPILPDEILAVVKELAGEILEEREIRRRVDMFEEEISKNSEILVRQLLHDMLYGLAGTAEECRRRASLLGMELEDAACACVALEADGSPPEGNGPCGPDRMLALGIQRIAEEVFRRIPSCQAYIDDDNRVYVAAFAGQQKDFEDSLMYCIERLQNIVHANLGVTVSAGIGGMYGGLPEISRSRREALRALEYKMSAGRESVIHIRDVLAMDGPRLAYPAEEERRMLEAVSRECVAELAGAVNAFFDRLTAERMQDKRIKAAVVKLYGELAMKLSDLGLPELNDDVLAELSRYDTLEAVRNWFLSVSGRALEKLAQYREEGVRSVIHNAEKFIRENYRNIELSLSMVAEHMGLTSSYFSRLFKQETGSSYIDYVISLRIEHARRLLRTTTHRIFDIGEMVGYPNSQYFCTLFRKACGVSPAEYREGRESK